MIKESTVVVHNDKAYSHNIGGWLRHLNSPVSEALESIAVDEIGLPNDMKAGIYKAKIKAEYDARPNLAVSYKQHLNNTFQRDFGLDWDEYINRTTALMNAITIPLLVESRYALSEPEQREILLAASNGHVAAMFWIGARLRNKHDDHCLLWFAKAHNCGHLGAAYEMALHLAQKGNPLEALRCLIVAADGGKEIAYLNIFHVSVLRELMFKVEQAHQLEAMLEELSTETHASCARYLKGVLCLCQGKVAEGRKILEGFMRQPRKTPPADAIGLPFEQQNQLVNSFIEGVLKDIKSGKHVLIVLAEREEQKQFVTLKDFDELVEQIGKKLTE